MVFTKKNSVEKMKNQPEDSTQTVWKNPIKKWVYFTFISFWKYVNDGKQGIYETIK